MDKTAGCVGGRSSRERAASSEQVRVLRSAIEFGAVSGQGISAEHVFANLRSRIMEVGFRSKR